MTPQPSGYLEVGLCNDILYARAIGLVTMHNCMCFRDFANHSLNEGCNKIIVDLKDCTGMDSTFIGILAGLALRDSDQGHEVIIINANEVNRKALEEVGVDEFVTLRDEPIEFPEIEMQHLDEEQRTLMERAELVRAAHENLVSINDRNKEKYGALLKAFTEQLSKKQEKSTDQP